MMRGTAVAGGQQGDVTWNTFAGKPCQVSGREGHLEQTVPGERQRRTPGTLSQENRARWEAGKDTWNTLAGKPWQVDGSKGHLEHFRGNSVPGGRRERHLERFRGDSVPGGQRGKNTWNTFAGIPCQVDSKEMSPGTLSQEYRARWEAGKDTWNTFAGKPCQVSGREGHLEQPCQVSGREGHLEHSRRKTVPGGKQERTPGTLSRGFRARWTAGKATWNAFAGFPCQVGGKRCYLEHFRRNSVAGGRQRRTPGTLLRGFRARWEAGSATCHAFAGIP